MGIKGQCTNFFLLKLLASEGKEKPSLKKNIDGAELGTLVDTANTAFYRALFTRLCITSVQGAYFLQLESSWKITGQAVVVIVP